MGYNISFEDFREYYNENRSPNSMEFTNILNIDPKKYRESNKNYLNNINDNFLAEKLKILKKEFNNSVIATKTKKNVLEISRIYLLNFIDKEYNQIEFNYLFLYYYKNFASLIAKHPSYFRIFLIFLTFLILIFFGMRGLICAVHVFLMTYAIIIGIIFILVELVVFFSISIIHLFFDPFKKKIQNKKFLYWFNRIFNPFYFPIKYLFLDLYIINNI